MIDIEKLKANFRKFCEENGLMHDWIVVEEYEYDDDFWTKNEHVWDEISYLDGDRNPDWEENQENLEIDIEGWFHSDYPKCPDDFPITDDLFDYLNTEGYISDENEKLWINDDINSEEYGDYLYEDKTYIELSDVQKQSIDDWWSDIDEHMLESNDWILEGLGKSDFEEEYSKNAFIETMAYWTIYFEPRCADWNDAWKAGLYPFEYYGTFMVALGGCGQDLSPTLDCYQALVDKTLPRNSVIFRDQKYFDYVSPVKHEEILNMCKREHVKIKFETEV